jgi:glutathione S-transferase
MNGHFITALRQNHALEHATVSLLTRKVGLNVRMMGRASREGFYIYGDVPAEMIQEAASEGLARLQRGESELAVSPFCGTNLTVAGILAGVACLLVLGGKDRRQRLPHAILAATCALIVAQPLGRVVQRHLTTSTNLSDVSIKRITRRRVGNRILYKIETTRESKAE